jgi:hypothetical protein
MHRKYAGRGLVAVSVSLDDPKDAKVRPKVDQFLRQQQADFPNFVLDATDDEWQDKLKIQGPPCVYVFNRDNLFVLKGVGETVDYAAIEKTVEALLQQ